MKLKEQLRKRQSMLVIFGLSILVNSCQSNQSPLPEANTAPRAVKLRTVGHLNEIVRTYPGKVMSLKQVSMSFPLGGPIQSLSVRKGQRVHIGDTLVRIDPRDYEVQVKTLEAQLNVSRAQLNHAQAEYSRIRGLFEHDNVSRSDFDTAQSALDMAQGQVDATTQALKKAKLALDDTLLKAPYDGTVADTFVDSYQRVAPFQPVLLFQGQGGLKVVIQVPENEMSAWMAKRKDSFPVSFDVLPGLVVEAHVAEFSTENDPLTQTFAVSLELTPPIPESVIPGMTASVQWPQSNGESAFEKPVVVIPLTCIVTEASGNPYVWKFQKNDNTLIKQVVKTGDLTDSGIVILKGLNPGDQILAAGIHFAFEGQTVRPMEE